MATPDSKVRWRAVPSWTAAAAYWLITVLSSRIQALVGWGTEDGVDVIAVAFFLLVALCALVPRPGWRGWRRLALLPAALAAHMVLTVPAAAALGVLKYSADHIRTPGEQRAVFLLASIPVLLHAMRRSRLFVATGSPPASG